jgi:hypothetical protein
VVIADQTFHALERGADASMRFGRSGLPSATHPRNEPTATCHHRVLVITDGPPMICTSSPALMTSADALTPGELLTWTCSTITRATVPTPSTGAAPGSGVGDGDVVAETLGVGATLSCGVDVGRMVELQADSPTIRSEA